jgi:transcriptional regulator with XRE-family HTH domain
VLAPEKTKDAADSSAVLHPAMIESNVPRLGAMLRARRVEKRLSLRDLADQIGVSLNTLSRVERGHVPDLKNFQRIVDWLELPAESFLDRTGESSTPEAIARHLRSDQRLTEEAARKIVELVEEMYHKLVAEQTPLAVHLRSARLFTPAAGALLAEILSDMESSLQGPLRE